MTSEHPSPPRWRRRSPRSVALWGALAGAGLAVLIGGAVAANGAVAGDNDAHRQAQATLANAMLRCLNTQVDSLVRPGEPVTVRLDGPSDFSNLTTLLQATEGRLAIEPPRPSLPVLSLQSSTSGASCHGLEVVATSPLPGGGQLVRHGTGASVPGNGPLPPPQL